jgi:hypothetical protein
MVNKDIGAWVFSGLFFFAIIEAMGYGFINLGSVISSDLFEA